jgi:hypothetical protein
MRDCTAWEDTCIKCSDIPWYSRMHCWDLENITFIVFIIGVDAYPRFRIEYNSYLRLRLRYGSAKHPVRPLLTFTRPPRHTAVASSC